MSYFARRVGGEEAAALQVGSPFDYERQMKLFAVNKMPDPREAGYRDGALTAWYMGVAALVECARSKDPEVRAIYDETHAFITGR
jgi:Rad3-related DNA helicase